MRGLGSLLMTLGLVLLGLALLCWLEHSHWLRFAALIFTVVGLFPLSWGLMLRWHQRSWAGFAAAGLALISGAIVAPGIIGSLDPVCLVIAGLSLGTATGGVVIGTRRLRQSAGG